MTSKVAEMTRKRAIGVWALIVVASLLLVGTATSVWVKRQALDTGNWVRASDEVLANPAVQTTLATYLVDQLYANVDVEQELADQLPENWQGIAGPIAAGLRQPATLAVQKLLASDQFKKVWHQANELAHQKLVAVLEDKGTYVSTTGGTVTLELGKLVSDLGRQLGLPQAALDKIPPDAGNIVLAQSDELANAQRAVKAIRWMGLVLGLVVIALYALAVYLAKGARRRTLRNIGWMIALVGLLLAITRRLTGNYVLSLLSDPTLRPAAKAVYAIGSQLLVTLSRVILTWGLVFVVGCVVAGPSRFALWVRRSVAPVLNQRWWEVAIGASVVYLLLLLWAPFVALQQWGSVIGLAVVLGVGLWLLRRQTLREFPDADLGDTARAARERLEQAWTSVSTTVRGGAGSLRRGAPEGAVDHAGQLERLARLHDTGALSDAEFLSAKAKLLA